MAGLNKDEIDAIVENARHAASRLANANFHGNSQEVRAALLREIVKADANARAVDKKQIPPAMPRR